jgi:hypothetical protein
VSTADMNTYFATRASQGFNTVLTELVADTYSGISTTNASTFDGIPAFTGTVAGGYPDLTTPNPAYWARMDTMVALAASHGITLMLVPADTGNNFGGTYMMQAARANGHANDVAFGTFLGNRYKNSPNVVWMHGNDYTSGSDDTYVAGIMQGIQAVWPSSVNTVEYTVPNVDSYSLQATSAWTSAIDLDQSYPGNNATPSYQIEVAAYGATPIMPAFLGEGRYEAASGVTNLLLREQAYWTMVDGNVGGYLYGNANVYGFTSGWQAAMSTPAVTQLGYWASLFRSFNWQTLIPDTANTFLTSGYGSGGTKALAARATDGSLAAVYNPDTSQNNITISRSVLGANPTITAVDPTDGATTNLGWTTSPTMGANAAGDHDWLFVITAG